jgi:hypothetical protein
VTDNSPVGPRWLPTVDRVLDLSVVGAVSPVARRLLAGSSLYWRVAPPLHRRIRHHTEGYVDPPLDPFQLYRVDPATIRRFTGREFPVWTNRWRSIGRVRDGDWDRRDPPVSPSYEGPAPDLYLANTFEETPLHRAMQAHFHDDVPWTETAFVRRVLTEATDPDAPSVWHESSSRAEVLDHCRSLDRLYESLRADGCVPARQHESRYDDGLTVRGVMSNEIVVDVGRDGTPLFVSGRHRLSIAKLLDFDTVPVAVAVRHSDCLLGEEPDGRPLAHPGDPIDVPW